MSARGKKPRADAHIADEDEVLECLTAVLRGTDAEDEKITPRDRLRAAELLARRFGALDAAQRHPDAPRIIDDISTSSDKED